jgi:hypothetical protein
MTKNSDFKKLVRARMQRTGESYAAARAQLADDAPAVAPAAAGIHPETAALVRVLAARGLTAFGAPASEALALGLGGGIGAACFAFDYKGHAPTFYVATRCHPQYAYGADFLRTAAERMGAAITTSESTPAAAVKRLRERLADGPVIAWVDRGSLPWSVAVGPAAELGPMPHVVVVDAVDDEHATVRDLSAAPVEIELTALTAARKRLRNAKHRLATVAVGAPVAPRAAVTEAIAACTAGLRGKTSVRGPMSKNFGIGGLRRWAAALADTRDAKRWTKVFPAKYAAPTLAWARFWIEHASTGGGGFRPLYAAFLDEAAVLAKLPALRPLAARYRELGTAWSALATAMLPDAVPALAAIRRAQDARAGATARGDLAALRTTDAALRAKITDAVKSPPLDGDDLRGHYADLAARVAALADAEEATAAALADV